MLVRSLCCQISMWISEDKTEVKMIARIMSGRKIYLDQNHLQNIPRRLRKFCYPEKLSTNCIAVLQVELE